jgi:hypothetical protein
MHACVSVSACVPSHVVVDDGVVGTHTCTCTRTDHHVGGRPTKRTRTSASLRARTQIEPTNRLDQPSVRMRVNDALVSTSGSHRRYTKPPCRGTNTITITTSLLPTCPKLQLCPWRCTHAPPQQVTSRTVKRDATQEHVGDLRRSPQGQHPPQHGRECASSSCSSSPSSSSSHVLVLLILVVLF